jgi:hypothetical protein
MDSVIKPDTDKKDVLLTNSDKISDLSHLFDFNEDDDDDSVIMLTDTLDDPDENDQKRVGSDNQNSVLIDAAEASVSSPGFEKALERVVDKLFSEKIEGMITGIIEKALNREIAKLTRSLVEDVTEKEKTVEP